MQVVPPRRPRHRNSHNPGYGLVKAWPVAVRVERATKWRMMRSSFRTSAAMNSELMSTCPWDLDLRVPGNDRTLKTGTAGNFTIGAYLWLVWRRWLIFIGLGAW